MDARVRYADTRFDSIISAEEVNRQAEQLRRGVTRERIWSLAGTDPCLTIEGMSAGYGKMQIVHGFDLQIGRGQSLCLIGPNGAGKSTVLHAIYGFARVFTGRILVHQSAEDRDITHLRSSRKLAEAGIAYILQDKSVFPDMTVEENLWMGGYLLERPAVAHERAEKVFDRYPRLAARRRERAKVLSGGERRLLEISRALVMDPEILLVDEPSIGLEPRFIDMVFEILSELQRRDRKTILIVEQNARKGLEFADLGCVLVSGEIAMIGPGKDVLNNPDVVRLFLGG